VSLSNKIIIFVVSLSILSLSIFGLSRINTNLETVEYNGLTIINSNPDLSVKISSQKKYNLLLGLVNESGIANPKEITIEISDKVQTVNNSWQSGVYSGYGVTTTNNSSLIIIYINKDLVKNSGWKELWVSKEVETLFVQALIKAEDNLSKDINPTLDSEIDRNAAIHEKAMKIVQSASKSIPEPMMKIKYAE